MAPINVTTPCRFHYRLRPMCETKKLKPPQIDGNYPFSQ